jgi:hypothetical protein
MLLLCVNITAEGWHNLCRCIVYLRFASACTACVVKFMLAKCGDADCLGHSWLQLLWYATF